MTYRHLARPGANILGRILFGFMYADIAGASPTCVTDRFAIVVDLAPVIALTTTLRMPELIVFRTATLFVGHSEADHVLPAASPHLAVGVLSGLKENNDEVLSFTSM